jgi:hypothetical protein
VSTGFSSQVRGDRWHDNEDRRAIVLDDFSDSSIAETFRST